MRERSPRLQYSAVMSGAVHTFRSWLWRIFGSAMIRSVACRLSLQYGGADSRQRRGVFFEVSVVGMQLVSSFWKSPRTCAVVLISSPGGCLRKRMTRASAVGPAKSTDMSMEASHAGADDGKRRFRRDVFVRTVDSFGVSETVSKKLLAQEIFHPRVCSRCLEYHRESRHFLCHMASLARRLL